MIRKATIKTKGRSVSSAMDADGWRRIICSNNFDNKNVDLRKEIENFIKKIYTEKVSSSSTEECLHSNSSLLTITKVYNQWGLGKTSQNHTKSHCVSPSELSCFISWVTPNM